MKKKNRKHCLELAKKVALARDGYQCRRCGRTKESGYQMHGSHIKGVGAYPNLSYLSRNIKCLCSMCHNWWGSAPTDSGIWFKDTFPEWYEEIKAMTREPVGQPDYDAIYAGLKEELNNLE